MSNYDENFDDLFHAQPSPSLSADDIRRIASETTLNTLQALQQGIATVQATVAEARSRAEKADPGFTRLYGDAEVCQRFIRERPTTSRAILNAENGYGTLDDLTELYHSFVNEARLYEGAAQPASATKPAAGMSELSLQQINSIPVQERRAAIEALGNRVGDMPLDEADSENARYKAERGE